jgi:magnesium chelatase subunit D
MPYMERFFLELTKKNLLVILASYKRFCILCGSSEHIMASFSSQRHSLRAIFPFSALVGQDEMRLALLLNAVSPHISGVLIRGEKGTAKSTAVRALQHLLPDIAVVEDCLFACDPAQPEQMCAVCVSRDVNTLTQRPVRLIELPLGATEDRLLGTLDLERAIKDGERHFEPGLLAAAHRGILYIDEVNLLPDHLVDALLDVAASRVNVIEREGISFAHPADFILIGTMNPEEGDLRPQLLDRFGLSVEIRGMKDPALRAEVVRRNIAFETDAARFYAQWSEAAAAIRLQIVQARQLLPDVIISETILGLITHICASLDIDGLRADITIYKAAAALAALGQRLIVTEEDVKRVAMLALPHRRRRQPFEQSGLDQQELEQVMNEYQPPQTQPSQNEPAQSPSAPSTASPSDGRPDDSVTQTESIHSSSPPQNAASQPQEKEEMIPPGRPTALATLDPLQSQPSSRQKTSSKQCMPLVSRAMRRASHTLHVRGRRVGTRRGSIHTQALALSATIHAAAPYQKQRKQRAARAGSVSGEEKRLWLENWDIFEVVRQQKKSALILFVVDASGSMSARQRMASAKSAVLALLQRAYQERDRVGFVQFRGKRATLLLPPTSSTSLAAQLLTHLPTGGRTPLASGLRLALRTFQLSQRRDPGLQPMLVLVTDGRANVHDPDSSAQQERSPVQDAIEVAHLLRDTGIRSLVIDTEEGVVRTGLAQTLSEELNGTYIELSELEGTSIERTVRKVLGELR